MTKSIHFRLILERAVPHTGISAGWFHFSSHQDNMLNGQKTKDIPDFTKRGQWNRRCMCIYQDFFFRKDPMLATELSSMG